MIRTAIRTIRDTEYRYTWSDDDMMIRQDQTGTLYEDAYDTLDSEFTYTETDTPVDDWEAEVEDYEEALEGLGVEL